MKAHVKINIVIQLESEVSAAGSEARKAIGAKYPLQAHHAGVVDVADVAEGERVIAALQNHVVSTFKSMGVQPLTGEFHKPDLAAAFGGDPEPGHCDACGHGAGYHSLFEVSPAGSGGEGPCWIRAGGVPCSCNEYRKVREVPS
jgi:hypothetical protein